MKEIRKTSQFKKDYKRFKNDKEFVETLMEIVKFLAEGNQIPEEYNPHPLKGNWKNYMECHIENQGGRIKMRSPPKVLTGNFRPSQLSFFLS